MVIEKHYPFDGQIYPSSEKKFSELIFFVHFFGGNKKSLLRHIRAVNKLGYDAFAFLMHEPTTKKWMPITPDGRIGWKHVYAEQIEQLLNLLPGQKIIFSFSNPSASAIEALSRRSCSDIKALICDSGPSSKLGLSAIKLSYQYFQEKKFKKSFMASTLMWLWSPFFHNDISKQLELFPPNFPILSIRGWKDPLISPSDIDEVFEGHTNLNWRKLSLPEAYHLDGLKNFPEDYLSGLKDFLSSI